MKTIANLLIFGLVVLTAFRTRQEQNVDFSCFKKHKASNTCHFNFTVDGIPYRFVDMGCKFENKKDDVIQKAKDGNLALAKEWKIACPAAKPEAAKKPATTGF